MQRMNFSLLDMINLNNNRHNEKHVLNRQNACVAMNRHELKRCNHDHYMNTHELKTAIHVREWIITYF